MYDPGNGGSPLRLLEYLSKGIVIPGEVKVECVANHEVIREVFAWSVYFIWPIPGAFSHHHNHFSFSVSSLNSETQSFSQRAMWYMPATKMIMRAGITCMHI